MTTANDQPLEPARHSPGSPSDDGSVAHYRVDEAGDPVLFNDNGREIIGEKGCSKYFIVGKLDITDCESLGKALTELRIRLLKDPYFANVPSMQPAKQRTALCFHAKDDPAEVRYEVYKLLRQLNLRFFAVVRSKLDVVSFVKQQNERDPKYHYRPDELYDTLVKELFKDRMHKAQVLHVCYAKRGNKNRDAAFRRSLTLAVTEFEQGFGFKPDVQMNISSSSPPFEAGLQAVDYYLWALQRYYELGEDRFIRMLWDQVGEIHDLDRVHDGRRGVLFTRNVPLPENPDVT